MPFAAYRQYTGGAGSLLDVLTTPWLGKILAAVAVLSVVIMGWKAPARVPRFSGIQHHAGAGPGCDPGDRSQLRAL